MKSLDQRINELPATKLPLRLLGLREDLYDLQSANLGLRATVKVMKEMVIEFEAGKNSTHGPLLDSWNQ